MTTKRHRVWSARAYLSATAIPRESLRDLRGPFRHVDILVVVGIVAAGAIGALTANRQLPVAAGLVGALLLVAIQVRHSRAMIALGLLLPLLPVLRGVPISIVLAGRSIYFSDVLLPLGLALAIASLQSSPPWRRVAGGAAPFAVVLALGTAIGLMNGWSVSFILRDIRGPIYLLLAFTATVLLFRKADGRAALRVMACVLWSAAILVTVESLTGRQLLAGRVETVDRIAPGLSSAGLDATRFLVAPKDLALLCCCAGLVLLLRGGGPKMLPWGPVILLPSLGLVFFSFSRRAFLAFAVAIVFVFLVTRLSRVIVRVLVMAPVVVGIFAVSVLMPLSADSYVSRQANAFSDRVLTGLGSEARSQDKGLAFRDSEDEYAVKSVLSSPVVGLGLGATYRPDLPGQPFQGEDEAYGRTYAHNFYLWLGVKLGVLGLAAFALFVLRPVAAATSITSRSNDPNDQVLLAVAAGVVGLCAVNWVAPIFNEPATAVVLGCALGILRLRAPDYWLKNDQPIDDKTLMPKGATIPVCGGAPARQGRCISHRPDSCGTCPSSSESCQQTKDRRRSRRTTAGSVPKIPCRVVANT